MRNARAFLRPLGDKIRELRARRGWTLDRLASVAGLSKGLLSKIENFRAVPSLTVLAAIARALEVDLAALVEDVQVRPRQPYLLVRAGEGRVLRREESRHFHYTALPAADCGGTQFQGFRLRIDAGATREPRVTDGDEFIHVLRGQVAFTLGDEVLDLAVGDSLYFDGRMPHAPRNAGRAVAELLVIYLIPASGAPSAGRPAGDPDAHR
ncbi:MAG TPA: XRE family transcriptional regulator [Planctomycetota bacterium]|nr:XRE family transcriptional regulator [Planctomycetota bacterium]